jgi:hypothetical protein
MPIFSNTQAPQPMAQGMRQGFQRLTGRNRAPATPAPVPAKQAPVRLPPRAPVSINPALPREPILINPVYPTNPVPVGPELTPMQQQQDLLLKMQRAGVDPNKIQAMDREFRLQNAPEEMRGRLADQFKHEDAMRRMQEAGVDPRKIQEADREYQMRQNPQLFSPQLNQTGNPMESQLQQIGIGSQLQPSPLQQLSQSQLQQMQQQQQQLAQRQDMPLFSPQPTQSQMQQMQQMQQLNPLQSLGGLSTGLIGGFTPTPGLMPMVPAQLPTPPYNSSPNLLQPYPQQQQQSPNFLQPYAQQGPRGIAPQQVPTSFAPAMGGVISAFQRTGLQQPSLQGLGNTNAQQSYQNYQQQQQPFPALQSQMQQGIGALPQASGTGNSVTNTRGGLF